MAHLYITITHLFQFRSFGIQLLHLYCKFGFGSRKFLFLWSNNLKEKAVFWYSVPHLELLGIECALVTSKGSIFTNILPINPPYWIYLYCSKRIIQRLYPETKHYLVSFFVKKTSSCQFQNKKKSVLLFQQKVFGREFSCPYKSSILWRHIFDWHEI